MRDLQSSARDAWEVVDQIIHSNTGIKRTVQWVLTKTIKQSEFTQYWTMGGRQIYIQTKDVLMFENIWNVPEWVQDIINHHKSKKKD